MADIVVNDPQTGKPYIVRIAGDTPTKDEQSQIQQFLEEQRQVVEAPV